MTVRTTSGNEVGSGSEVPRAARGADGTRPRRTECAVVRGERSAILAATPHGPGGSPAGTRPARPVERHGSARPGGRRGGWPLPPARPAVAGGGARGVGRVPGAAGRGSLPTPVVARSRRRVALALVVAALLAVGVLLGLASSSTAGAPAAGATTVTVVRPGESLQDVARRATPGGREREVAARIRELNALPDSAVSPGQPLVVPGGAETGSVGRR